MSVIGKKVKEQYQDDDAINPREKLLLEYLPLVKKIASRMNIALPPSLDAEDLIGSGIIGLLEAWERYDPSRGVAFASFAAWRIKGAIVDELRKITPAPRSLFTRFRQLNEVSDKLRQELNREPEQREISIVLGWPESSVEQLWANYNLLSLISLDTLLFNAKGEENVLLSESVAGSAESPETIAVRKEQQQLLTAALGGLPNREKLVLSLYYLEELSQKEIAGLLQVSTVRVSQLHARAVQRLREILSDEK